MNTSSTQGRPRLPVRCCQVNKALETDLAMSMYGVTVSLEWSRDIPVRALLRILLLNIIEYTNFS